MGFVKCGVWSVDTRVEKEIGKLHSHSIEDSFQGIIRHE